jgi:hypothetical protein
MRLNLAGFWRVLVVLYVGMAVVTVGVHWNLYEYAATCPDRLRVVAAERKRWDRIPVQPGADYYDRRCDDRGCMSSPDPLTTCGDTPSQVVQYAAIFMLLEFSGLFGAGLVIRWIYRGFSGAPTA